MIRRAVIYSGILLLIFIIGGCMSSGAKDLSIYQSAPPYSGEPEVMFGAPTGGTPLFQFRYVKEGVHDGFPREHEMREIKKEGARLGAKVLVLDCPSPGLVGSGMCMVYGYTGYAR